MKKRNIDGFTVMVCFGSYAGFSIEAPPFRKYFRLLLGWVSIAAYPYDIENAISNKVEENDELRSIIENMNSQPHEQQKDTN